jgi:hypothetical protein
MSTIALPSSVAELLKGVAVPVQLVDENGSVLGSFSPARKNDELTPDELAEVKRRMNAAGPRYTTRQVLEYLDSIESR